MLYIWKYFLSHKMDLFTVWLSTPSWSNQTTPASAAFPDSWQPLLTSAHLAFTSIQIPELSVDGNNFEIQSDYKWIPCKRLLFLCQVVELLEQKLPFYTSPFPTTSQKTGTVPTANGCKIFLKFFVYQITERKKINSFFLWIFCYIQINIREGSLVLLFLLYQRKISNEKNGFWFVYNTVSYRNSLSSYRLQYTVLERNVIHPFPVISHLKKKKSYSIKDHY